MTRRSCFLSAASSASPSDTASTRNSSLVRTHYISCGVVSSPLSGNVVLKLPDRLWTMLLTRCPDLEVLYLGGTSSSQPCRFDLRPLTQGKWPKLHSLTICKALIIEGATGSGLNSKDLSPFLSSHPALKKLRVVWPSREPLIGFTGSSIALDSYWGSVLGITDVASSSCNLKELTLMDSEGYTSGQIHLIRAALRLLPSLSSLSIWLDFSHRIFNDRSEGYECDHIKSVRSILACCPELLHFKFTCTTTPHKTFPMVSRSFSWMTTYQASLRIAETLRTSTA